MLLQCAFAPREPLFLTRPRRSTAPEIDTQWSTDPERDTQWSADGKAKWAHAGNFWHKVGGGRRLRFLAQGYDDELHVFAQAESWMTADPSKSARIQFLGSTPPERGDRVVVSFPGVYGAAWNQLTSDRTKTTCVFLPDESSEGYGLHVDCGSSCGHCHCHHLYGKAEPWGCKWFEHWVRNTHQAADAGAIFHVVTKHDGSLGHSQEGEVRFLAKSGYRFYSYPIGAYVNMWTDWNHQRLSRQVPHAWLKDGISGDSSLQEYEIVELSPRCVE